MSSVEQFRAGFEAWFDNEFPADSTGARPKYRKSGVMDLMRAAWLASKREASTEPSAVERLELELMNQRELVQHWKAKANYGAGALPDEAKDAARMVRRVDDFGVEWAVTPEQAAEIDAAIAAHTKGKAPATAAETMDHDQLGKLGQQYANGK